MLKRKEAHQLGSYAVPLRAVDHLCPSPLREKERVGERKIFVEQHCTTPPANPVTSISQTSFLSPIRTKTTRTDNTTKQEATTDLSVDNF